MTAGITSCTNNGGKTFTVEGSIGGLENATLLLETMTFPNMNGTPAFTAIDTVTADPDGNFIFSGHLRERSICRIKMENNPRYYLLLNIYDEKLHISGSTNDPKPLFEGSTATLVLNGFIDELRNKNMEIIDFSNNVLSQSAVLGDSLTAVMNDRKDAMIDSFYAYVANFADTTKELTNKIVALENLLYDRQFEIIKEKAAPIIATGDTSNVYVRELTSKVNRYQQIMDEEAANSFLGKTATDLNLPDPDGKPIQLSSLRGKYVLLDFWASWCAPCRKENPNLVALYEQYKDKGFTVYSVSLDDNRDAWMQAIRSDKLSWPSHVSQLQKWNSSAAAAYNVTGIPASFLLDTNGVVIAENIRSEQLSQILAGLLGE
ncbi:MAG: redoxin domain-containing protein [Chitinophagales bacterium]|nr:redoxin domain-containing protein [Chitinophagales bacterium]